jgi:hypothetical protein
MGGLRPLSRSQIERELASGAGCALDGGEHEPLLVAVSGDAIVNDGGTIVHLRPSAGDLDELMLGGRFTADGIHVEIQREHRIEQVDEVTTWQATLRLTRGPTGFASFHHRWTCGA